MPVAVAVHLGRENPSASTRMQRPTSELDERMPVACAVWRGYGVGMEWTCMNRKEQHDSTNLGYFPCCMSTADEILTNNNYEHGIG